jgi:hypothetical protein
MRFERPCPGRATSSRRPYADHLPQSGSIPMSEAGSIPMSVKGMRRRRDGAEVQCSVSQPAATCFPASSTAPMMMMARRRRQGSRLGPQWKKQPIHKPVPESSEADRCRETALSLSSGRPCDVGSLSNGRRILRNGWRHGPRYSDRLSVTADRTRLLPSFQPATGPRPVPAPLSSELSGIDSHASLGLGAQPS